MNKDNVFDDILQYLIKEETKTAEIIGLIYPPKEVFIPKFLIHDKCKYLINKISSNSFVNCNLDSIQFDNESKLETIEKNSFYSSIQIIQNLPSTAQLQEGWCCGIKELKNITINSNERYKYYEEKFLLSKSNPKSDIFDVLEFARRDIKTAIIPSFIKYISSYSFQYCEELVSIQFQDDSQLQRIGSFAFQFSKIEKIDIPVNLKEICDNAFQECSYLKEVNIPKDSKIEKIGYSAFLYTKMVSLIIPSYITNLCEGWFQGSNLFQIQIRLNSKKNKIIIPYENQFLISKSNPNNDDFDVLHYAHNSIIDVKIPAFIKRIAGYVFDRYLTISSRKIESIEFTCDSQLQSIGPYACAHSNIRIISFPCHLKQIEHHAFYECQDLQIVKFQKNCELEKIGKYSFFDSFIQIITIPPSLKKIGSGAFSNCIYLKKICVPKNSELEIISSKAFEGSTLNSILIPSNIIKLKENWCKSTANLNCLNIIQNKIQNISFYENKLIIGKSDFKSDIFDVLYFAKRDIKTASIPPFIKRIASSAFEKCKQLISVDFSPNSQLQFIDDFAFSGSSIHRIIIPKNVIRIGTECFLNCSKLKYVDIQNNCKLQLIEQNSFSKSSIQCFSVPQHVKEICKYAFNDCSDLCIIEICEKSELSAIKRHSFFGCDKLILMIDPKLIKLLKNFF